MTSSGLVAARVDFDVLTRRILAEAFVVLAVALFVYIGAGLVAAVHDDEPLFADPAHSAVSGFGFRAPVLSGLLPGAETRLMWQPPGYLLGLAGWFRLVGFGLVEGRLFSAIGTAVAVATVYATARRLASRRWVAVLAASVVAASPWTVQAATTIRPDAWCAAFFAGALAALISWWKTGSRRTAAVVVVAASGALLIHPIGAIATITVVLCLALSRRLLLAISFAVAVAATVSLIWALYVTPYWSLFASQMIAQSSRKSGHTFGLLEGSARPWGYVLVLLILGIAAWRWRRGGRARLVLAAAAVAALAGLAGGEDQYPLYLIVAVGPLLAIASERLQLSSRVVASALAAATLLAVAWSLISLSHDLSDREGLLEAAAVVGSRPVYLDYGAAALYFRSSNPSEVRVVCPVPTSEDAVAEAIRARHLLLARANAVPPSGPGGLRVVFAKGDFTLYALP